MPRSLPSLVVSALPFGPPPTDIKGSSIANVSTLMYVILPLTAKSPVITALPVTVKLPTLALPVTLSSPAVVKLPPDTLLVAFNVPVIFAPDAVTTNTLATPATLVVILPLTPTISTLLVPFAILETAISPAINVPVTVRFETVIKSVVLSNVKLASCPNAPSSLKNTLVLPVGVNVGITDIFPELFLTVS